MTRDFLRELGIEDKETINKILSQVNNERGALIEETEQKTASTFESHKINELEEKLSTANKTINDLKEKTTDNALLQRKIDQYEKDIQSLTEKATKDRIEMYIDLKLTQEQAINPKTVKPLLDYEKFELSKSNEVIGVDEQIKALKDNQEYAFLFKAKEPEENKESKDETNMRTGTQQYFGGYEPLAGEPTKEQKQESFGEMMGRQARERYEAKNGGAQTFWNDFGNGSIRDTVGNKNVSSSILTNEQ